MPIRFFSQVLWWLFSLNSSERQCPERKVCKLDSRSHSEQNRLLQGVVANHRVTSKWRLVWAVLVREQFSTLQAVFQVVFYKCCASSLPEFSVCVLAYTHTLSLFSVIFW